MTPPSSDVPSSGNVPSDDGPQDGGPHGTDAHSPAPTSRGPASTSPAEHRPGPEPAASMNPSAEPPPQQPLGEERQATGTRLEEGTSARPAAGASEGLASEGPAPGEEWAPEQEGQPTRYNPIALAAVMLVFIVFCVLLAVFFFSSDASSSGASASSADAGREQSGNPTRTGSREAADLPGGESGESAFSNQALARQQRYRDSLVSASSPGRSGSEWQRADGQRPAASAEAQRRRRRAAEAARTSAEERMREREQDRQRRRQRENELRQNYFEALAAPIGQPAPGVPSEAESRLARSTGGPSDSLRRRRAYYAAARTGPRGAYGQRGAYLRGSPRAGGVPGPAGTRLPGAGRSPGQAGRYAGGGPGGTLEGAAAQRLQRGLSAQAPPERVSGLTEASGPLPRFVLSKGTIIPIVLESAVSSDLGGLIVMRVVSDVLGRNMEQVLVPAGTEIVSGYGAPSLVGQKRLVLGAGRMNLPNGRFVDFRNTDSYGPLGQSGTEGERDRHLLSRFGAAGALAVLSTGLNASSGPSVLFGGRQSFQDRAARSGAQQVNRIVGQILERQTQRQPTITLEAGTRGALVLNEDVDMKRPYYARGTDQARIARQTRRYQQRPFGGPETSPYEGHPFEGDPFGQPPYVQRGTPAWRPAGASGRPPVSSAASAVSANR